MWVLFLFGALILGCQMTPVSPLQTPKSSQIRAAAKPRVLKHYPAKIKVQSHGSITFKNNVLKLSLQLPPLKDLNSDFSTQKLDLNAASTIVASVSDSHGKIYAPVGAVAGEVTYPGTGVIVLSFNNVIPDPLLLVELQVKDGSSNIVQADLAAALKHNGVNDPSTTINFQTTASAKAMKALLTSNASRARAINLTDINSLMGSITGVTGTAPNFSYTNHPTLVNTAQMALDLMSTDANALTPASYRQNGATVALTVSGLQGADKLQVQVTDAASAVSTNLGNGSSNIINATPGTGLKVLASDYGTPAISYIYTVTPSTINLTEGDTTNVTITAAPAISISGIAPSTGATGSSVVITGTGFTGSTAVNFSGGVSAVFSVDSNTQITATVPAGTIEGQITVVNGASANSSNFDVQRIMYVKHHATGSNNGGTWANAYTSLQSALTAASSGDEIWVAAGTYTPHASDRDVSFILKENVPIYGGFNGLETLFSQRNPATNTTVLSGDLNGDDNYLLEPFANTAENTKVIVKIKTSNVTFDGFTVNGAYHTVTIEPGGLEIFKGFNAADKITNITISNMLFTHNTADIGGSLYMRNGTISLSKSKFINNRALDRGGAIFLAFDTSESIITDSLFEKNKSVGNGGAINLFGSSPTLQNIVFLDNQATDKGGALSLFSGTTTTLTNATFLNNTAVSGGGIYKGGSTNIDIKNILLKNSSLDGGGLGLGTGLGNIDLGATDPFVSLADPDGPDNLFGTADDGLKIASGATTVINQGISSAGIPTSDILGTGREGLPEPGAYEYITPLPANVIAVDIDATGANDGISWGNAYTSLQSALSAATAGKEIWVAEGMYTPHASDNSISFQLKENVDIYGGFSGSEALLTERDFVTHLTILSGDLNGDDNYGSTPATNITENTRTVVKGEDNTILDGFTIQGGNATGYSGGGMNLSLSSPTLSNLIFSHNSSVSGGGGVNIAVLSNPIMTNIQVLNNTSNSSGAGLRLTQSNSVITNLTVANNIGTSDGSAGGIDLNSGTPIFTNLIVTNNSATGSSCAGGISTGTSSPVITNAIVINNAATGSSCAGGIKAGGGNPVITNTVIANNTASGDFSVSGVKDPLSTISLKNGLLWNNILDGLSLGTGLGNVDEATDPFVDSADPDGADDTWFTADDGLRISVSAVTVINQGITGVDIPLTDILGLARVSNPEPGAYEYIP